MEHATELAERIIELGGLPTNTLGAIEKGGNAPYPGVMKNLSDYSEIIKIVTTAEAGAIDVYDKIEKKGKREYTGEKVFKMGHWSYEIIVDGRKTWTFDEEE